MIRNKKNADCWTVLTCFGESKYWTAVYIWSDGKFVTEAQRRPNCAIIQSAWKPRCAQCAVHPFVYKTWKLPIVHFVIHSCQKLFLGFSSLANESPFNPDFIGRQPVVALETSYKWRLSRKNRPFPEEPSHLTHHLMQPRDKFNHSRKFALLCK